jgi:hypothetical protein
MRLILPSLLLVLGMTMVKPAFAQYPLADSVLAEREFSDTTQSVRVTLFRKTVYRIALSRPGAHPRFTPLSRGVYPPVALQVSTSGPIGGPVFEVHVDRDGEYDVGLAGLPGGMTVRFRLETDRRTTADRQMKADTPGWSLGVRGEIGRHSGYLTSATPDSPESGMVYDGCVVISNGTWLSLCLGGGADARGSSSSTRVAWIFGEVHARLFALNASRRLPTNFGVMMRVAQGGAGSDVSRDPSYYGAGGFMQQWFTRSPNGRGVSALLSAQYGVIRNSTLKGESTTMIKAALQWLP